jgi:acyl dehydratase
VNDPVALAPWSVRAVNLREHSGNPVHTDEGARAAGHERALVAGTTVYAYLTHSPAVAWGEAWLGAGGGEVRFRSPVFDDDLVELVPGRTERGDRVEARSRNALRATFDVWLDAAPIGPMRGERQPTLTFTLDDALAGYGARTGDDLALYRELGVVHPVITTVLGNRATMAGLVDGPWIHVRSAITHQGLARPGEVITVESSVVDRFDSRAGERGILDVRILVGDRPIAAVEHESIIRLA